MYSGIIHHFKEVDMLCLASATDTLSKKVYNRFILKVQGNVRNCEHQTDTLFSARDFWGKIIEFQTKTNFTNSHTGNFNFFKVQYVFLKSFPSRCLSLSLSEMNDDQDGGKIPNTNSPTLFL